MPFPIYVKRMSQVELLADFRSGARGGRSLVRQLIMGMGKSQVISPLLALVLGGEDESESVGPSRMIISLVVPPQLLSQTAGALAAFLRNAILDIPTRQLRVDRTFGRGEAEPLALTAEAFVAASRRPLSVQQRVQEENERQLRRRLSVGIVGLLDTMRDRRPESRGLAGARAAGSDCEAGKHRDASARVLAQLADLAQMSTALPLVMPRRPAKSQKLPRCLLPSLMRNELDPAAVGQWPVLGAQFSAGTTRSASLIRELLALRAAGGILLAPPEAPKALLLAHADLLHTEAELAAEEEALAGLALRGTGASVRALTATLADWKSSQRRSIAAAAESAAAALRILRADDAPGARSIAVLDEVDLLIHPLRSELNYPLGDAEPLHLGPLRWRLAMHLVTVVSTAASAAASALRLGQSAAAVCGAVRALCSVDADAVDAASALVEALRLGAIDKSLFIEPELFLLDAAWYPSVAAPLLARVACAWLRACPTAALAAVAPQRVHADFVSRASLPSSNPLSDPSLSSQATPLSPTSIAELHLAQRLVACALPHALSRKVGVHYGLLPLGATSDRQEPPPRRLLAVPYLGKVGAPR